jgi:hypothetical protein
MINNVYGNSQWMNIQTYQGNRPYINTTQPIAGMVRYNNTNGGCMEVYDGSTWQPIANGSVDIDLNENAKRILEWAEEKMHEEKKLQELLARHPGLKDLHDKFEMMKILCQEEEKHK